MKFDVHEPIVFALSSAIPERRRAAVRDGVLYWNQAFGRSVIRVIDAPPGVRAPSPDYNVIQWVTSGDFASTSYIQSDPLTGQILHAHVFVLPETMMDGDLEQQNDHLRYIVAHEVGHALGLRHNFAPGASDDRHGLFQAASDSANRPARFELVRPRSPTTGQSCSTCILVRRSTSNTLPPFCTDSQQGCLPFRPHAEGIGGHAWRRARSVNSPPMTAVARWRHEGGPS